MASSARSFSRSSRAMSTYRSGVDRPIWVHLMANRRRKTIVICRAYHEDIHAGRHHAPTRN